MAAAQGALRGLASPSTAPRGAAGAASRPVTSPAPCRGAPAMALPQRLRLQRSSRREGGETAGASCAARALPRPSRRRLLSARATAERAEAVTIDNCTVMVVGDGGVGMEVVRKLAKAGSWVTAFHAGEGYRKEIEGLGAMLLVGEAASADKIERALRNNSFDAIVYAIGDTCPEAVASRSAQLNVIIAARAAKVPRFLLVSSAGGEDDIDLESVEANLREGGDMKWTIIRTAPLSSGPAGKTSLSEDSSAPLGSLAAADLAYLISQILFDADFEGKVLCAVSE